MEQMFRELEKKKDMIWISGKMQTKKKAEKEEWINYLPPQYSDEATQQYESRPFRKL